MTEPRNLQEDYLRRSRDLVSFVRFKNREKQQRRSETFSKVEG